MCKEGIEPNQCRHVVFCFQYKRDEPGVQYRKLFIGGLDKTTDDSKLKEHFETWGEIVDVVVIKNPETKQ